MNDYKLLVQACGKLVFTNLVVETDSPKGASWTKLCQEKLSDTHQIELLVSGDSNRETSIWVIKMFNPLE